MTPKISLITAVGTAALVLGAPAAFGKGQPVVQSPDAFERAVLARELGSRADAIVYRDAFERAVLQSRSTALPAYRDAHSRSDGLLSTTTPPSDAFERAVLSGRTSGFIGDSHERVDVPSLPVSVPTVSSGGDIEWPQIGIGFAVGILLALALAMAMRLTGIRPLAH